MAIDIDIDLPEEYISEIQYPDGTIYKVKDSEAVKTRQDIINTLGFTPYNSTNPNGYITSSALNGYATQSYVTSQGYITSSYHDSTKQNVINDLESIRSGAGLGATALQSISSSDVTAALGFTPYNATNPNGYITSSYHDSTKQDTKDILTYPQLQKYTTVTGTSVTIGSNSEQNSSIYSITPTGNTTFTFGTTAKSGYMTTFELRINMTTVYSMTFPSTVKWLDGETPDLSQTGLYYLVFRYDQPSGFYLGNLQGRWEV